MSNEAERATLGSIILSDGSALDSIIPVLGADGSAFASHAHGTLYEAAIAAYRRSGRIDTVQLVDALGGRLEAIGGVSYIAELCGAVATSSNAEHYAAAVKDSYCTRRLKQSCQNILAETGKDNPAAELIESAEAAIFEISQSLRQGTDPKRIAVSVPGAVEYFESLTREDRRADSGLPTGVPGLDSFLGGLRGGEVIVVAARPGCGKTALMLQMARALSDAGTPVLFFSLEMERGQLARRMLSSASRASAASMEFRPVDKMPGVRDAGERIKKWPMWIDDAPRRTVWEIRGIARRWRARQVLDAGKGCVFLDYLQLCQLDRKSQKGQQRYIEIGEICHSLKALSREIQCPIVIACQLARSAETETDGYRMLGHLRESGDIEQDADAVVILSGLSDGEKKTLAIQEGGNESIVRLTLAKHRHGRTGKATLIFRKPIQVFDPLVSRTEQTPRHVPQYEPAAYEEEDDLF